MEPAHRYAGWIYPATHVTNTFMMNQLAPRHLRLINPCVAGTSSPFAPLRCRFLLQHTVFALFLLRAFDAGQKRPQESAYY
jgi:hypothetical protein